MEMQIKIALSELVQDVEQRFFGDEFLAVRIIGNPSLGRFLLEKELEKRAIPYTFCERLYSDFDRPYILDLTKISLSY